MTDVLANLAKYSESPLLDQDSVPAALRRDHSTKAGVWGRIVIINGALSYLRPGRPAQVVTSDAAAIIYPEELHSVHPKGAVTFKVEFYRQPAKDTAA